jgi:hypothetical protein
MSSIALLPESVESQSPTRGHFVLVDLATRAMFALAGYIAARGSECPIAAVYLITTDPADALIGREGVIRL